MITQDKRYEAEAILKSFKTGDYVSFDGTVAFVLNINRYHLAMLLFRIRDSGYRMVKGWEELSRVELLDLHNMDLEDTIDLRHENNMDLEDTIDLRHENLKLGW